MKKDKSYKGVRFDSIAYSAADKALRTVAGDKIDYLTLSVQEPAEAHWNFDKFDKFLAACDKGPSRYCAVADKASHSSTVSSYESGLSSVSMESKSRDEIEQFFQVIEQQVDRCKFPRRDKTFKIF